MAREVSLMTFPHSLVPWALMVVALVALAAVGGFLRARKSNSGLRRRNAQLQRERETLLRQRDALHAQNSDLTYRQASELSEVRKDAEEETKAVLKAAVRTLQGLADEQQVVIEKAQTKHGDDDGSLLT